MTELQTHFLLIFHALNSPQIVDVFVYSISAWYFMQVWPSKYGGKKKKWYFPVQPRYWFPTKQSPLEEDFDFGVRPDGINPMVSLRRLTQKMLITDTAEVYADALESRSSPNVGLGKPTVRLKGLRKTFGSKVVVSDLTFDMFENQIFALLGRNGAGKASK